MYKKTPFTEGIAYLSDVLNINKEEVIELCPRVWSKHNEHAWRGYIPKQALLFDSFSLTEKNIYDYFHYRKYTCHPDSVKVYDRNQDPALEGFAKLVWLTHDYIKDNGFSVPVGSHYNPRLDVNVIHPGGSRNQIINLFGQEKVECIYFNTGGYQPPWLNTLKKVNISQMVHRDEWVIGAVADHGTLIPHFSKFTDDIPVNVKKFQHHLYRRLSRGMLRIHSDQDLTYLDRWVVTEDSDYNAEVVSHQNLSDIDQCKITLLICAGMNYSDKNYTVTCKDSTN